MAATAMLRKDHEILRQKLDVLEGALQVAPHVPFMLREVCHSLTRLFEQHVRREEHALAPYAHHFGSSERRQELETHAHHLVMLEDLNAMLLLGIKMPTSVVVERLAELIRVLRTHMADEETGIFPVIDREEALAAPGEPVPAMIRPSMSANEVMRVFPETKPVFARHGVTCGCEGCDCLDELAWRRGLNSDALLEELRAAAEGAVPAGAGGA